MRLAPLIIGAILFSGQGCATHYSAPFRPPGGLLVTSVRAPLSTHFNNTPVRAEHGEASTIYMRDCIFTGIDVAFQECDIASAVKKGDLATVDYADYDYFQILGIFGRMKVNAYGSRVDPIHKEDH